MKRVFLAFAFVIVGLAVGAGTACNKDGPFGCPDDHVVHPGLACTEEGIKCTDESSACGQVYVCQGGTFSQTAETTKACSDAGSSGHGDG